MLLDDVWAMIQMWWGLLSSPPQSYLWLAAFPGYLRWLARQIRRVLADEFNPRRFIPRALTPSVDLMIAKLQDNRWLLGAERVARCVLLVFIAISYLVAPFLVLPNAREGWHTTLKEKDAVITAKDKVIAAKDDQIGQLQRELDSIRQARNIGSELQGLSQRGEQLWREIFFSTDEVPTEVVTEKYDAWRHAVHDALIPVSVGKAQYVDADVVVPNAGIVGMKSEKTRRGKEKILLHLRARLVRLAEVIKAY